MENFSTTPIEENSGSSIDTDQSEARHSGKTSIRRDRKEGSALPASPGQDLLEWLKKQHPELDQIISQSNEEAVAKYAKNNPPIPAPVEPAKRKTPKELKARIALLHTFYPITWV